MSEYPRYFDQSRERAKQFALSQIEVLEIKSRMILQVHDELLFEVHKGEIDEVSCLIKKEMEGAWKLKVPLRVEMGMGKNWAEAH